MGLFFRNYNKPGPGIDKDAPQKKALFRFLELLSRKSMRLIGLNILYFIVLLPVIVCLYVNVYSMVFTIIGLSPESIETLPPMLDFCAVLYSYIPSVLHIPLLVISLLLYGPATMGLTYMFRNFVREQHTWINDFFVKARENWKQGLFFGILDIIATVVLVFNWNYGSMWTGEGTVDILVTVVRWISLLTYTVYFFMRFYTYQLAVTVRLPIRGILKNSAIFAILGLWRNLLATALILVIAFVSVMVNPLIDIVMLPLIMFSLCGLIAVFTTYPIIAKHVLEPAYAAERERESELPEAVLPPELGGPGAGSLAVKRLEEKNDDE